MATGDPTLNDPFRPTACPRCEYALTGLPMPGVCPECGRAYGPPEVCLYGYAIPAAGRTPRKVIQRSTIRRGLAWVWGMTLLSFGLQVSLWRWMNLPPLARVWVSGWLLLTPVLATRRTMADRGSGPVQVRLGPDGVRQGFRGLGAIPYDRADHARLTPWSRIGWAAVHPAGEGQVRITLSSPARWWQWRRSYVSALVWCPPAAVATLEQRVAAWRTPTGAAAPHAPVSPWGNAPGR